MKPDPLPAANSRWPVWFKRFGLMRCSLASSEVGSPAAVAEGGRYASHRRNAAFLSLLCLLLISIAVTSGCATCGRSSVPANEKKGAGIGSDRSLWGGLLDLYGTH